MMPRYRIATPNFTAEEPGRTDGGSPSPVVEPLASHPPNEVQTLENIINEAIKLKDDMVYLERTIPSPSRLPS